jgi:hypothetical protein
MIVNPYAILAYNESRGHQDDDVRKMVKEDFLATFMEIVEVGISACEDFKTVNMYHISHSDTVHDNIRDYSSFEVLTSESAPRANRRGISVVPAKGIDVMKQSIFYDMNKKLCILDPETYAVSQCPKWLPRFRRLHISDVISLNMQSANMPADMALIQSDTFFLELRHLDEQDEYFSLDGFTPMTRMKVLLIFADKFWKIFCDVFNPSDIADQNTLGLVIRPSFSDDCLETFDNNKEKWKQKYIEVSRNTTNILDRMILGFDNIRHEMSDVRHTYGGMEDAVVRYDMNLCPKNDGY